MDQNMVVRHNATQVAMELMRMLASKDTGTMENSASMLVAYAKVIEEYLNGPAGAQQHDEEEEFAAQLRAQIAGASIFGSDDLPL